MNNPQKRPLQPVPPPKQSNPAIDELVALRQEISEFRKDFAKFKKQISLHIAFGVIGSLILVSVFNSFLTLLFHASSTPLTRQFDDAARQARIAACESEKGYQNTEDCYK